MREAMGGIQAGYRATLEGAATAASDLSLLQRQLQKTELVAAKKLDEEGSRRQAAETRANMAVREARNAQQKVRKAEEAAAREALSRITQPTASRATTPAAKPSTTRTPAGGRNRGREAPRVRAPRSGLKLKSADDASASRRVPATDRSRHASVSEQPPYRSTATPDRFRADLDRDSGSGPRSGTPFLAPADQAASATPAPPAPHVDLVSRDDAELIRQCAAATASGGGLPEVAVAMPWLDDGTSLAGAYYRNCLRYEKSRVGPVGSAAPPPSPPPLKTTNGEARKSRSLFARRTPDNR
jgi:hypothetical protein